MNPVPGYTITTPYKKRGSWWSCDEDANGNGVHTRVDYTATTGTKVVAARPGKVVHANHGSAFGSHQIDILCDDGTRDFYAHMRSRVANGTKVKAGDKVGEVGAEGNVSGPHLHFERHATHTGGWSCTVHRDPAPSINYQEDDDMSYLDWPEKDRDALANDVANRVWKQLLMGMPDAPDGRYAGATMSNIHEYVQKIYKATD